MNPSVKAALLSALIFPGAGHISLGHKKRGWIIISINVAVIYFIITEVMQKAQAIVTEMQQKGSAMDIESILNATSSLSGFSDNTYLNTLLVLFIVSWVTSIFAAYWAGQTKE